MPIVLEGEASVAPDDGEVVSHSPPDNVVAAAEKDIDPVPVLETETNWLCAVEDPDMV